MQLSVQTRRCPPCRRRTLPYRHPCARSCVMGPFLLPRAAFALVFVCQCIHNVDAPPPGASCAVSLSSAQSVRSSSFLAAAAAAGLIGSAAVLQVRKSSGSEGSSQRSSRAKRARADSECSQSSSENHSDGSDNGVRLPQQPGRRLWEARLVAPAGVSDWSNTLNCTSALAYECPCGEQCLSRVSDNLELYKWRACQRQLAKKVGGWRDFVRHEMESHFRKDTASFGRSVACLWCYAFR